MDLFNRPETVHAETVYQDIYVPSRGFKAGGFAKEMKVFAFKCSISLQDYVVQRFLAFTPSGCKRIEPLHHLFCRFLRSLRLGGEFPPPKSRSGF